MFVTIFMSYVIFTTISSSNNVFYAIKILALNNLNRSRPHMKIKTCKTFISLPGKLKMPQYRRNVSGYETPHHRCEHISFPPCVHQDSLRTPKHVVYHLATFECDPSARAALGRRFLNTVNNWHRLLSCMQINGNATKKRRMIDCPLAHVADVDTCADVCWERLLGNCSRK